MVKDKTKDGAVPGMVESKVNKIDIENVRTKEKLSERVMGNRVHCVFHSDIVGRPLAENGDCCSYDWDGGCH